MNECFTISLTECIHVDKHILPFCSLILYGKSLLFTLRTSMLGTIANNMLSRRNLYDTVSNITA